MCVYIQNIFKEFCVGELKQISVLYLPYSTRNTSGVLYCNICSMVRCKSCIVNNETRWHIQVNSAKISILTEAFA